jgi:diadenylate cyclase
MSAVAEWYNASALATMDVWDWVDIGVLAVVIYRVLILMRGTRAIQSLLGLGLVVVLYLVSMWLDLSALHWVLDQAVVYVVLALLILFQDDIRRALARAGGTFFGRRTVGPNDAVVMEDVIRALFALAHRKIGALIVLERNGSLASYAEGAHPLDAVVSTELLQSVFHPSSPLHDGAVIIADNRLLAAGVFLPISLSKDLSRTWGTRHRAAIGLSEETDGICLVASEERGTVAVVVDGRIIPVADANDMRQILAETLEARVEEPEEGAAAAPGVNGG